MAAASVPGSISSDIIGDDTVDTHTPRKRKASGPPAPSNTSDKSSAVATRQKITRACDSCKVKKTRCTGTLPCTRCTRLSLPCRYNAAYSRGLPPAPLPGAQPLGDPEESDPGSIAHAPHDDFSRREAQNPPVRNAADTHFGVSGQRAASLRNSPEPGSTDFEGNYLGPASGISFINRVWSRLHQDEKASVPDELQNASSSQNTAVFSFGDSPFTHNENSDFMLPSYEKAMEMVTVYFDFSMVTYRFIHRGLVEKWVKYVYENNISRENLPTGNMVARTAIVLMLFAVSTMHAELQPGGTIGDRIKRYVVPCILQSYTC